MHISGSGAVVGDDLPGYTIIGSNNLIGHHAVVGVKCQDLKYKVSMQKFLMITTYTLFSHILYKVPQTSRTEISIF